MLARSALCDLWHEDLWYEECGQVGNKALIHLVLYHL